MFDIGGLGACPSTIPCLGFKARRLGFRIKGLVFRI